MSPKVYGVLHRLHHAHADTEEDPHSPKYSSNFMKLMVKTYHKFAGIQSGKIEVQAKLMKNLPDWKWFDKMAIASNKNSLVITLFIVLHQIRYCMVDVFIGACAYCNGSYSWNYS